LGVEPWESGDRFALVIVLAGDATEARWFVYAFRLAFRELG